MLYYSYTLMFSLVLQHCCYGVVCCLVRSLIAFVCQEIQDAQLSQRDRAAGCVIVFAKSRTLELEDNDLRTL